MLTKRKSNPLNKSRAKLSSSLCLLPISQSQKQPLFPTSQVSLPSSCLSSSSSSFSPSSFEFLEQSKWLVLTFPCLLPLSAFHVQLKHQGYNLHSMSISMSCSKLLHHFLRAQASQPHNNIQRQHEFLFQ